MARKNKRRASRTRDVTRRYIFIQFPVVNFALFFSSSINNQVKFQAICIEFIGGSSSSVRNNLHFCLSEWFFICLRSNFNGLIDQDILLLRIYLWKIIRQRQLTFDEANNIVNLMITWMTIIEFREEKINRTNYTKKISAFLCFFSL